MRRRLADQVLILEAIESVRQELKDKMHESWIVHGEILVRLVTLYSLLDPTRLKQIVKETDDREDLHNERKVA